jgi:hypothetical protein
VKRERGDRIQIQKMVVTEQGGSRDSQAIQDSSSFHDITAAERVHQRDAVQVDPLRTGIFANREFCQGIPVSGFEITEKARAVDDNQIFPAGKIPQILPDERRNAGVDDGDLPVLTGE